MKKTYTFEVQRKIQWPKTRCPECGNGWIEAWHQIDPNAYEACEERPWFHAAWTIKCPNCGLQTFAFHSKHSAWKAWKDICKTEKDKKHKFDYLFTEEE
jgi:ribosomal protein S27AE